MGLMSIPFMNFLRNLFRGRVCQHRSIDPPLASLCRHPYLI
jgi:hypothetical protein